MKLTVTYLVLVSILGLISCGGEVEALEDRDPISRLWIPVKENSVDLYFNNINITENTLAMFGLVPSYAIGTIGWAIIAIYNLGPLKQFREGIGYKGLIPFFEKRTRRFFFKKVD